MNVSDLLTTDVDFTKGYRAEIERWMAHTNAPNSECRTIQSLDLEEALIVLKKDLRAAIDPEKKLSLQELILDNMFLFIQVHLLRDRIQDLSGQRRFSWRQFGVEATDVSANLTKRKNGWNKARGKLEKQERKERQKADGWKAEEELRKYLQGKLSDTEIEVGMQKIFEPFKVTEGAIVPIETLRNLPYQDVSDMLAAELEAKLKVTKHHAARDYKEDAEYLEVNFTRLAWVFVLDEILAEKRDDQSPKDSFTKDHVKIYLKSKWDIHLGCLDGLGSKVRLNVEDIDEETLKKLKEDVGETLMNEESLHLTSIDIEAIKDVMESMRGQKGRQT